jgi:hypothetical protein
VLLPIFLLTFPGTIRGGLAYRAVLDLEIRRCYSFADDAAIGHDCCWIRVEVCNVTQCNGYKKIP